MANTYTGIFLPLSVMNGKHGESDWQSRHLLSLATSKPRRNWRKTMSANEREAVCERVREREVKGCVFLF